jgi:hypothetical protein
MKYQSTYRNFPWQLRPRLEKNHYRDDQFERSAVVEHRRAGRVVMRHTLDELCQYCEKKGMQNV